MVEDGSTRPIRVGFVIAGLYGGGAERSLLSIIEALDRRRFTPTLILFEDRFDHAPPNDVPVLILPRRAVNRARRFTHRILQTARLVKEHEIDLLVSFLMGPNVVAIAAARMADVPIIAGERSAPRKVLARTHLGWKQSAFWSLLVRTLYPRASLIMTNTEGASADLMAFLHVPRSKIAVIHNPIDIGRIVSLAAEPLDPGVVWPDDPVLVHIGRFSYAKDHETLLRAFALVRRRRPMKLVLVGAGEDEQHVRRLCRDLDLEADVVFAGFTSNPYKYLARATLSVLTSRFEGLPNVLIESMALGVPIVSTACQYGPIEILGRDEYGVLAPVGDAEAFARAVESLLDDPARRQLLAERGRVRAQAFDRRRLGPMYEELFARVAGAARSSAPHAGRLRPAHDIKSGDATST